jgi:uncharacterized repeat protein (TIGR01451 family)
MRARQRSAGPALLALCGCLTAALAGDQCLLGALPVPARTAQGTAPSSPEPPLVEAPAAPPPAPGPGMAAGCPGPADPPVPVVALRVRVPAQVHPGQELEYHLFVENRSAAAAHHVLVRNPLPANARFVRAVPPPGRTEPELLWELGTLEPCARREIVLVLASTGPGEVRDCARVQFEHGECVRTRVTGAAPPVPPAPAGLVLTKQGPAEAHLYDALTYRLTVSNRGTSPAAGVRVTDTLPEGLEPAGSKTPLTWDLGTLEPGQQRSVEYQALAKKAGRWTNRAVVTTAAGDRREASATVLVGSAGLELTKTGPARRFVNRPATYQLTVRNPGSRPATNVVLTDVLPERVTFVSASDGGRLTDRQVQWSAGTLAPGARRTVQVVLRATAAGEVVNRATARADRDLKAEAQAATVFEAAAGLTADVEDQDDPVAVGAETKYTITVLNQGAAPATGVVVRAMVPEEMEVRGADGPAAYRQEGRQVVFGPIALPAHDEKVYEVRVQAVRPGDVRFRVELTADQLTAGPVRREESTTIFNPNVPQR